IREENSAFLTSRRDLILGQEGGQSTACQKCVKNMSHREAQRSEQDLRRTRFAQALQRSLHWTIMLHDQSCVHEWMTLCGALHGEEALQQFGSKPNLREDSRARLQRNRCHGNVAIPFKCTAARCAT